MKKIGVIIILVGLVITVFTGFNFTTQEKVVDIGKIKILKDKDHHIHWSPLAGIALMAIGGGIYLVGRKEIINNN
jgi:drug/metabolite transporter (DMT)-like permease